MLRIMDVTDILKELMKMTRNHFAFSLLNVKSWTYETKSVIGYALKYVDGVIFIHDPRDNKWFEVADVALIETKSGAKLRFLTMKTEELYSVRAIPGQLDTGANKLGKWLQDTTIERAMKLVA